VVDGQGTGEGGEELGSGSPAHRSPGAPPTPECAPAVGRPECAPGGHHDRPRSGRERSCVTGCAGRPLDGCSGHRMHASTVPCVLAGRSGHRAHTPPRRPGRCGVSSGGAIRSPVRFRRSTDEGRGVWPALPSPPGASRRCRIVDSGSWDACRLRARARARRARGCRDCMTMHSRCIVMRVMHNTAGRPASATTTTLGEPPVSGRVRP